MARKRESYVVMVGNRAYWPRESALKLVRNPLDVVLCPGCGERLAEGVMGCSCGFSMATPIPSVKQIVDMAADTSTCHERFDGVSPAFIAAIVAAARSAD